ncbi:MAG TPA: response regulator transcription factor [Chroococcales cyanobacterium]
MARILLVEDDEAIGQIAKQAMTHERHVVDLCMMGSEAEEHIRSVEYDLLILDWGLPDTTGLEICRMYRMAGGLAPILFLTARASVREKTLGFTSGADDYLTKPFDVRELILRINALLKRPKQAIDSRIQAGDVELDWIKHKVYKNGQEVQLSPIEFQVLEFLVRHQNQCFSQEALLTKIWPIESDATVEAVKATIKRVRQKIDPDQDLLRTVHGVGYILETKGR